MGGWQAQYGQLAQMQPIDTDALQQPGPRPVPSGSRPSSIAKSRTCARDWVVDTRPRGATSRRSSPRWTGSRRTQPLLRPRRAYEVASHSPPRGGKWCATISLRRSADTRHSSATSIWRSARESVAVSALPDGRACYGARLREMTTLAITADEVHRSGLEELERIKKEERAIAHRLFKTVGSGRGIHPARTAAIQVGQPRRHHRPGAEGVRACGRRDAAVVRPTAENESHRDPDPARRRTDAADRYQVGTIDGKRPGEYQINGGKWIGQPKVGSGSGRLP